MPKSRALSYVINEFIPDVVDGKVVGHGDLDGVWMLDPVADAVAVAHLDRQDQRFAQEWQADIDLNLKILWPDHFL